jgi:hypothetical protein
VKNVGYEFQIKVSWDGETGSGERVSGTIELPDISDDNDLEVRCTIIRCFAQLSFIMSSKSMIYLHQIAVYFVGNAKLTSEQSCSLKRIWVVFLSGCKCSLMSCTENKVIFPVFYNALLCRIASQLKGPNVLIPSCPSIKIMRIPLCVLPKFEMKSKESPVPRVLNPGLSLQEYRCCLFHSATCILRASICKRKFIALTCRQVASSNKSSAFETP